MAVDGNGDLLMTSAVVGGPTKYGFGQVEPERYVHRVVAGRGRAPGARTAAGAVASACLAHDQCGLAATQRHWDQHGCRCCTAAPVVGSRTWSENSAWPGTATCSQSTAGSAKGAKLGTI